MPVEVKVPPAGESITEGRLARWLKPTGAVVRRDEPVAEMETEKATTEIVAPSDGVLRIAVPEGSKVLIGTVVAHIDEAATPSAAPVAKAPVAAPPADGAAIPAVSPAARVMAAGAGVDPRQIAGTGRGGVVLKEDVQTFVQAKRDEPAPKPAEPVPVTPAKRETRQRMSALRARIAERLLASQATTATLTTFNEADMSAINDLRARFKEKFKEKHGVNLGFMSFFVKAAVDALKAFPTVNAWIDGEEIVHHHYYDIGVAVSTDRGLMVPVLRNCDQLSFAQIEKGIADLAVKARDGKIRPDDLHGGTFTITNGGIFGSMMSTPILNPPQSAILGMHAIQKRAVVVNDQIVVRPMMYLALSYDHRLIDGREAVQFLVRIKDDLESPERMLLEI
jgi:2-oxoglutarate dehydrogenase E2 component (dihydrolipoamide succinyltransferase)